uniref:NF-kappa-B essential modulator NEMO CC2-LZ domain-containing protein n=1 Tax=Catharus ustulatus TaxID=91951 RepID=A0A8C3UMJ8_CATUS
MDGRGPYHIYDPGGSSEENGSTALERLVEENARLKEKMQGIKSIGELLEESQVEASKLRQKAEDLVKDNKMLIGSSSLENLVETGGRRCEVHLPCCTPGDPSLCVVGILGCHSLGSSDLAALPLQGSSSEFEIVAMEDLEQPPTEDANLLPQLQQLENTLSGCAKEASKDQVFVRMGYMASELKRLASKVHKNEQRTSFLQTLCETLHSENKELRTKLEHDLEQRNQALEKLSLRVPPMRLQQSGAMVEKAPGREELEAKEKKVKILEHQRRELLEVNKQWDQHFRSMKQKYEQKVGLGAHFCWGLAVGTQRTRCREVWGLCTHILPSCQVKIFEEDFQRERSDRERMNEEKEELKQQLEKLQKQLVLSNNQVSSTECYYFCTCSLQASGERLHPEPGPGPLGPACPMYQYQYSPPMAHPMYHGYEEWQQIRYPPAMPGEHTQGQNFHHFPPVRL